MQELLVATRKGLIVVGRDKSGWRPGRPHFPGEPVMPGVLQVEAMAQAAGILMLRKTSSEGKTAFFMSADKVKFRKAVRPGDQLVINAKLTKNRGNRIGVAECTCTVGGTVVSSGELMFSVMDSASEA